MKVRELPKAVFICLYITLYFYAPFTQKGPFARSIRTSVIVSVYVTRLSSRDRLWYMSVNSLVVSSDKTLIVYVRLFKVLSMPRFCENLHSVYVLICSHYCLTAEHS